MARSGNALSVDAALGSQDFADEQRGLLDLIDKLRYAQLDNVKLPQVVVFGDQSAGKSSVLEAITGTPFPREAGACTRFATEIRLRRAPEEKFSVRIIPDKHTRTYQEQERLKQFGVAVDESTSFQQLMKLAIDQIAPKNVPGRFATEDILVVEKEGPGMPLLTIVDLPGLVTIPNNDQNANDIKAINDLTDRYMKSSRTIILAVVGGNHDYVQAPVLAKAREFDPNGARTIGVLTKPDLTESIGLEDKFISLVNNKDQHNQFDLGWYVLLNPGPREPGQAWPSPEQRKQAEDAFFTKRNWSTLPKEMCGATALKQKLSVQLQQHIGKHVRTLQKEIKKAHDDYAAELKLLGTGKDTVEEMKDELVQLCSDSKELVTPAVHGTYTNPPGQSFFPRSWDRKGTPAHKLRARAVEENRQFAERVRLNGRKLQFSCASESYGIAERQLGNISKQDFARKEVEPLLHQNTGTEFPLDHNPRLVYTLFQGYAENWSKLAQHHMDNLGMTCNEFLSEVIDFLWPQRMREPLRTNFLDPHMRGILGNAQTELDLLQQDLHFEVQPYDPEYIDHMKKWRAEAPDDRPHTEAEEVLEKMLIFYELSAKTFISNVITQVIERHLMQGLLNVFSWVKINRMTEETVLAIAAENEETRNKRLELKAKLKSIEQARDICASLAMRKELRAYSKVDSNNADESSDVEEPSTPVHRVRQRKSPRPSQEAESLATTPASPQRPPSHEQRQQSTPIRAHLAPNGSGRPDLDTGSPYSGEIPTERNGQAPPDQYRTVLSPPQQPPPPPPRSEKVRHQVPEQHYPLTPPSSTGHSPYFLPGQGPDQYPTSDQNSHQHSKSYSHLDLNGPAAYINDQTEPHRQRQQRKVLGMKI